MTHVIMSQCQAKVYESIFNSSMVVAYQGQTN